MSGKKVIKVYPLSFLQEGMLFHSKLDDKSTAYFIQYTMTVIGEISKKLVDKSFSILFERHEILRSFIVSDKVKSPVQVVLNYREPSVNFEDITHLNDEEKEKYIKDFELTDKQKGFNLEKDVLMRISILKTAKEEYTIIWCFHHIIIDGWSMGIVLKEFVMIYSMLKQGKKVELGSTNPYSSYIDWLGKRDKLKDLDYWKEYLESYENAAYPLGIKNTTIEQDFNHEKCQVIFNKNTTDKINKTAVNCGITVNTVLQTVWGMLLLKYNRTNDIVYGFVTSGRPPEVPDIEGMVGLFINTIPIRISTVPGMSFKDIAQRVYDDSLEAKPHEYCSLADIQSNTKLHSNLINHILVHENHLLGLNEEVLQRNNEHGFTLKDRKIDEHTNYDFTIIITPRNEMLIEFNYNSFVYEKEMIYRIGQHFKLLIEKVIENPNLLLDEIELVTSDEKNKILYVFNNTKMALPKDKTVLDLFEEYAEKTSNNIALVFENMQLTYKELNAKVNQLARVLREKGVKAGSIVGIMAERSFETIIAILGVLKAGGAYLPLDHEYPDDRIKFMIKDSNATILLTQRRMSEKRDEIEIESIWLDNEGLYTGNSENLNIKISSSDLAYVIYTSGSTGKPKGVMIEHLGMYNHILAKIEVLNMTNSSVVAQNAPLIFDISVWQCLAALAVGGTVAIYGNDVSRDAKKLLERTERDGVTILEVVPSLLNSIIDIQEQQGKRMSSVKQLLSTGEELSIKLANKFISNNPNIELFNAYGPTEASDDITHYRMTSEERRERVPIGKPIRNMKIYILNEHNKLQPIGILGELCVSGAGVGRGYLNRAELTAEKFVENPFIVGERMYRTGDLARWLPDGNIEYLGRIDHQVKIRGFRIELGEIENRLIELEFVKEAVVMVLEDKGGDKYLCAYVVADQEVSVKEFRTRLSKNLLDYMIPSYFMQLDKLPLTLNGKIDRKSLPIPQGDIGTEDEYEAPRNETEKVLVRIWGDVLGKEKVGIHDNFFELGGHSLKAMTIINRINHELDTSIPLAELFKTPYISHIANYISEKEHDNIHADGLVMLKKGIHVDKNLFFVHAAHGRGMAYIKVASHMSDEFSCWGIDYERINTYDPYIPSVEELAEGYIAKIKKIQKKGPYYISGWCIGGMIAFEMVRQMEKLGDEIQFLGIYNTTVMILENHLENRKTEYSINTELAVMQDLLPEFTLSDDHKNITSVEELWKYIIEDVEKIPNYERAKGKIYNQVCKRNPAVIRVINDPDETTIKDILHSFNLERGVGSASYKVHNDKIKAKISYFIATREEGTNRGIWSEHSLNEVDFYKIDADHFSMFEIEEDAKKLADTLNRILI